MSTTVAEILGDQSATEDNGFVRCSRSFNVTLDAPASDGALVAMYATGIPARGDLYPSGPTGKPKPKCINKRARPLDATRLVYRVDVEYSNEARIIDAIERNNPDVPPWELDQQVSYDFTEYQAPLQVDFTTPTAKPLVNAAGEPFDPPVEVTGVYQKIVITRATQSYSHATAAALYGSVNSADITVNGIDIAAGRARLLRWSGSETSWTDSDGNSSDYYEESIEIEVRNDGFDLQVRNEGYHVLADGNPSRIIFSDGQAPAVPQFLTADGTSITATPNYITFRPYPWKSWAAIGLE